jgi:hypothetical protein
MPTRSQTFRDTTRGGALRQSRRRPGDATFYGEDGPALLREALCALSCPFASMNGQRQVVQRVAASLITELAPE